MAGEGAHIIQIEFISNVHGSFVDQDARNVIYERKNKKSIIVVIMITTTRLPNSVTGIKFSCKPGQI